MRGAFVVPAFIDAHAHLAPMIMTADHGATHTMRRRPFVRTGTPERSAQNGWLIRRAGLKAGMTKKSPR